MIKTCPNCGDFVDATPTSSEYFYILKCLRYGCNWKLTVDRREKQEPIDFEDRRKR